MTQPNPGARDHGPPGTERLLAGLTPEQAQAVTYGPGPLLLLAGPGAGKTRTLTHRAAYLLASGRAQPWEILVVTFSVRAASELRLRLADLLGETVATGVTAATFHSVCARLLREHAGVFGRTERYTIYDQADMRRVVDWLLSDAERGEIQRALVDYGQPASQELLAAISAAKNRLLTPDEYDRSMAHPAAPLIAAVSRESEVELQRCNALCFDDLLAFAVRLLGEHPQRLAWLRQRWRWILVDETQDTSRAQATLVDLLAGPDGNLCVCGDDDQVIHTWRHADPRHILDFHERQPSRTEIVLGRNFRSHSEILEAGVRCVSHNERRAGKALIAMRGPGGTVRIRQFVNEFAEANWVTAQIADALVAGTPPTEILVLARTGYATEPRQRALAHAGIPHRVLGSLGLYERTEVRDGLAYLTLIQNPVDAQAFRRAISSPRRGIGAATVTKLVTWARERHDGDLIAASARAAELDGIRSEAARTRLVEFGSALDQVRTELAAGRSIGHVVIATVTLPGGLVRHYEQERDYAPNPDRRRDAERVLEDLRSLCRAANAHDEHDEHATLTGFLEQAAGLHAQELDATTDRRITVSTIHRAKGVEAQAVALLGCEEELLPSWRSVSSPNPERLAEERRLFYVAATRAKDRLLITHVAERGRRPTGGPPGSSPRPGSSRHPPRWPPETAVDRRPNPAAARATPLRAYARASNPIQMTGDSHAKPEPPEHHPACSDTRRGGRPVPTAVCARRDRLPAMTKVPYNGQPYAGAQVAAYIGAQSMIQRLNGVVPGCWRQQFQTLPAEFTPAGSRRVYVACRLIVTLPVEDGGHDVEAVYEDLGEMDSGSLAGVKALYSDARERAAVAAGIGAYLYTSLEAVVLPIGPNVRHVRCIRRQGKSDLLALSPETEQWLRNGYAKRMATEAVRRDLGEILARGEPENGIGQGEVADQAAQPAAEAPATESAGEQAGPGTNGHGEVVTVDFGDLGPAAA
jgi:DNA helicase-2/ATP-dependent DNA helicase PcrA